MKKIFTLLTVCLFSSYLFADSGGPDGYGYTWKDSNEPGGPVYNWIDILSKPTATEVKLLADDNLRGPFYLNFNFHYYWYDVTQFWVGSNGYLKFNDLSQLAAPFPTVPSTELPNDYVGPYMNDLVFATPGDTAKCWYWISPSLDTLIVSWIGVPFWSAYPPYYSGSNTFQIILSTVDSSITFQYKQRTGTSPFGTCTSVGFENNSGAIGLQVLPYCTEPPTSYAIKIYHPQNPTLEVTDVEPYYIDNPGTGAIFLPQSSTPYPITAQIRNVGNTQVASVPAEMEIKDPSGNVVAIDTAYTDTLDPGESVLVTFFDNLIPSSLGTFKYVRVKTLLTGDGVPGNNNEKLEVVVVDTTQDEIRLGYDAGNTNQITTVNWAGVGGGAGMYFIPPFYPVQITKIHYYMYFGNGVPMAARVWDDDGIGGLPYTLFDSIYVDGSSITDFAWNDFTLDQPIVINSGGFYLSWNMLGSGQTLGSSTKDPFSHRSYEVFNNAFSPYRFNQDQDPMINATIEEYSFPTGTGTLSPSDLKIDVYPNPAQSEAYVIYEVSNHDENVWLRMTSLSGMKLLEMNLGKQTSGVKQVPVDLSGFASGMYLAEISCGGEKQICKVIVTE
ncbi:MAG: T9SS type A sorting domain-containing protein [Bacteroidetes bacterium]|nr:T9SS type A sorting domain-containing protein [Bacteroidota bacterium]